MRPATTHRPLPDALWDAPPPPPRPLDVTYVLPHQHVTGGMKILLEHLRRLRARGHRVRAVLRGRADRAVPAWSDAPVDEDVVLGPADRAGPIAARSDVVVVGWYQNLPEWADAGAPVLYFEQGHELLFGEPGPAELEAQYRAAMGLPVAMAAVSPHVAGLIERRFARRAGVVVNGIDLLAFRPEPHPPGRRVLLVGHPGLPFKGFSTALEALARAAPALPGLTVTWVSQVPARLPALPFPVQNLVGPPQAELPAVYRGHDLYLCASRYESFPLPPIEAMASGVPVVTTRCGGVTTYAVPGWNCAMAPVGDAAALAQGVVGVLGQPEVARCLAGRGRATAERFSWDRALDALEDALLRTARATPSPCPTPRS